MLLHRGGSVQERPAAFIPGFATGDPGVVLSLVGERRVAGLPGVRRRWRWRTLEAGVAARLG